MCGIVGYTGENKSASILVDGLKKLEYRGYDSAGISVWSDKIVQYKSVGNITALKNNIPRVLTMNCGIAHTRWATHGAPTVKNAHPHLSHSGKLSIVHNGIIENYLELKAELSGSGFEFKSETDTEVLVNLIDRELAESDTVNAAIIKAMALVKGSYAFALICSDNPGKIYAVRNGSPLVIGLNGGGSVVASDIVAFNESVNKVRFLDNGEMAVLNKGGNIELCDLDGNAKGFEYEPVSLSSFSSGKAGYEDYMLKEIYEQAESVKHTFHLSDNHFADMEKMVGLLFPNEKKPHRIIIVACGTSWHAGLVGKMLIEKIACVPVVVEYASEFRYREPVINRGDVVIFISQSGETADTLGAVRMVAKTEAHSLGLCNVETSTLVRETDAQLFLNAGVEIGVASTKAFTSQILALAQLAFYLGEKYNNKDLYGKLTDELKMLPFMIEKVLGQADIIKKLADRYCIADNFLFIGRGVNYPVALEGALKLKEISYIHAEGYPGAEMKHGPIALIDYSFPTIAILADKENLHRMITGIKEIQARNGKVIAILTEENAKYAEVVDDAIIIPDASDELTPVLSVIPLQLFAYYVAKIRGCNVDQPRNLAKSVTVE